MLQDLTDKTIILWVLDLSTPDVEDAETVADRAWRALDLFPEPLVLAPDCGLEYLPRDSLFGKMRALASAALPLREEIPR